MFDLFKKERKDPVDVARAFSKEHDIKLEEDVEPTPEGEGSSPEDQEENIEDDKSSQEGNEDETPEDAKPEAEDKDDDKLSEEDRKLVDTEDDDLDDEGKVKKKELIDKKNKKRDTGAEKRINELISKVKGLEEKAKERDLEYEAGLAEMKEESKLLRDKVTPSEDDIDSMLAKKNTDRMEKYLAEDAGKAREQKREMEKEELDDWLVEDFSGANAWMIERHARRQAETEKDRSGVKYDDQAKVILKDQNISRIRVEARHPELKSAKIKERRAELVKEGLTPEEAQKTILKENDKYRIMYELMQDKKLAEKVFVSSKGPELLEKEMLKQLENKPEGDSEKAELETRIAELEDILKAEKLRGDPVGAGVGSRSTGGGKVKNEKRHNPELAHVLGLMKKKGLKMTEKEFEDQQARRATIPGAEEYKDEA